MTYYSAKEAFARLTLYLREHKQAALKVIWRAHPTKSTLYRHDKLGLTGIVGGWIFLYEDAQSKIKSAVLTCWGEVQLQDETMDVRKVFGHGIEPQQWVLDNTDAHAHVLRQGGEGLVNNLGGWLMTADVEGRGIRPVWAGGTWYLSKQNAVVVVDAQSGELYRPGSGRYKLAPLLPTPQHGAGDWDGDFDEESLDAVLARSDAGQLYWWPRVYQSAGAASSYNYIYNRKLLREKLQAELAKPTRSAASWRTSGVLHAALGEWANAVDHLSQAVQREPQNTDYQYYRALSFLIIRDLDKAVSALQTLPKEDKRRADALEYLAIVRGEEKSSLIGFMINLSTDVGYVPLEVHIGPYELAARHHE